VPFHFGAACKLLLYPSYMQQLQPKRHTLVIDSCAFFACVSLYLSLSFKTSLLFVSYQHVAMQGFGG
jgi:hypothetical protein